MNKDYYCSYELSEALKEAGFCEMTYGKYVDCPNDPTLFHGMQYEPWNLSKDEICAPLLYQAQKWLRKEKDILVVITPETDIYEEERTSMWDCMLWIGKNSQMYADRTYSSYEEALIAGITKAVELL